MQGSLHVRLCTFYFYLHSSTQASSDQRLGRYERLMRRREQNNQAEACIDHTEYPVANSIAQWNVRTKQ